MSCIKIRPGIICVEIHECYLLVAVKEARTTCPYICRISEMGALVWKLLSEGKSTEEIIDTIRKEYDIPQTVDLKTDILEFINNLSEQNYTIEK